MRFYIILDTPYSMKKNSVNGAYFPSMVDAYENFKGAIINKDFNASDEVVLAEKYVVQVSDTLSQNKALKFKKITDFEAEEGSLIGDTYLYTSLKYTLNEMKKNKKDNNVILVIFSHSLPCITLDEIIDFEKEFYDDCGYYKMIYFNISTENNKNILRDCRSLNVTHKYRQDDDWLFHLVNYICGKNKFDDLDTF